MNIKQNEKIEMALNNVSHYKDFEEFENYNNLNREDFKESVEDNYIQEITLGTYNGASDRFINSVINDENIIKAINNEIKEIDFSSFFDNEFIKENNIEDFSDWILLYTEFYYVFTLDNSIYVTEL